MTTMSTTAVTFDYPALHAAMTARLVSLGAPVIEGPGEDLLLAICGRQSALPALHGDGVPELAARISR